MKAVLFKLFGSCDCCRSDVRRDSCHVENVGSARFVLSLEGTTASARTLDVRRMWVGIYADYTKQIAGRNQFCESHTALQQRVVGCAAGLASTMRVVRCSKVPIDCGFFESATSVWLGKSSRVSIRNIDVVLATHR